MTYINEIILNNRTETPKSRRSATSKEIKEKSDLGQAMKIAGAMVAVMMILGVVFS